MGEQTISALYLAIAEWAGRQGARQVNALPNCWEGTLGDRTIAINGHGEPRPMTGGGNVPPYSIMVLRGGWPEAMCDPGGGALINASEDELIQVFTEDNGNG